MHLIPILNEQERRTMQAIRDARDAGVPALECEELARITLEASRGRRRAERRLWELRAMMGWAVVPRGDEER